MTRPFRRLAYRFAAITALTLTPFLPAQASAPTNAGPEPAIKLDRVEVRSDRIGDEAYRATRSSTAAKTDTRLLDTPESVVVVTREQMDDQQMASLGDVVRYVAGIGSQPGESNRDVLIFRGNNSSADFFLNGVRDDVQYLRDVYNLERVEVLLGPNAMIFGRGAGGGLINRVTKEADFSPRRAFSLSAGSFGAMRATVDVDQPLKERAALRLNGVDENSGSFRDFVQVRRQGVAPSVTFLADKQTKLNVSYEYFHDNRTADRGIPALRNAPAPVPIDQYYGNPDDSFVRGTFHFLGGTIDHRTAAGLNIRNRTLFGDYDRAYQAYLPGAVNPAQTQVALATFNNATHRANLFNQTDLTFRARFGGIQHTLLGGVEFGRQRTENFRQTGFFNNTTTSLNVLYANPLTRVPVTYRQSASDADNHLKLGLGAAYAQDQIEFNAHWQAVAGARFDVFSVQYRNGRTGEYIPRRDELISPRAALLYKPIPSATLYASYTTSHLPSSGDQFSNLTTVTQQVKPEHFANYELGAKVDVLGSLSLTTALYRLDRTNTRATDPTDPNRIVQTGSQQSNGFEIGFHGSVGSRWTTSFGYAYQHASVTQATAAARAGAVIPAVPRHSFSAWNKLRLLPNLDVGLGLIYRTETYAAIDNTVTLPGYVRTDVAGYDTFSAQWLLQANLENVFDRKYYLNADSNTNIAPGSPRALRIALVKRY